MNRGDLVKITHQKTGEGEVVVCYKPEVIKCFNHYGSYHAIQMINSNGTIVCYPVDRWSFEVIR